MSSIWKRFQRVNQKATKFRFILVFDLLTVEGNSKWQPDKLNILMTRRSRRFRTKGKTWEPTLRNPYRGICMWPTAEGIELTVTLFKDSKHNRFEDKVYHLYLEGETSKGRMKQIAVTKVDFSQFANASHESPISTHEVTKLVLQPLSKKMSMAHITFTVTCQFLKEGQATDEDMISIASLLSLQSQEDIGNLDDFNEGSECKKKQVTTEEESINDQFSSLINQIGQFIQKDDDTTDGPTADLVQPDQVDPSTPDVIKREEEDTSKADEPGSWRKRKDDEDEVDLMQQISQLTKECYFTDTKSTLDLTPKSISHPEPSVDQGSKESVDLVKRRHKNSNQLNNNTSVDPLDDPSLSSFSLDLPPMDRTSTSDDLLNWCKQVTDAYPGVKVTNLTTSWRNGMAFCALLHHFHPQKVNFPSLSPSDIRGNCRLAFDSFADLGVNRLLDPEEMVRAAVPDKLNVMTYLFQLKAHFEGTEMRVQQIGGSDRKSVYAVMDRKSSQPTSPQEKDGKGFKIMSPVVPNQLDLIQSPTTIPSTTTATVKEAVPAFSLGRLKSKNWKKRRDIDRADPLSSPTYSRDSSSASGSDPIKGDLVPADGPMGEFTSPSLPDSRLHPSTSGSRFEHKPHDMGSSSTKPEMNSSSANQILLNKTSDLKEQTDQQDLVSEPPNSTCPPPPTSLVLSGNTTSLPSSPSCAPSSEGEVSQPLSPQTHKEDSEKINRKTKLREKARKLMEETKSKVDANNGISPNNEGAITGNPETGSSDDPSKEQPHESLTNPNDPNQVKKVATTSIPSPLTPVSNNNSSPSMSSIVLSSLSTPTSMSSTMSSLPPGLVSTAEAVTEKFILKFNAFRSGLSDNPEEATKSNKSKSDKYRFRKDGISDRRQPGPPNGMRMKTSKSYAQMQLDDLEKEQKQIDDEGILLERKLRLVLGDGEVGDCEDIYVKRWFNLVNKKNALLRRQAELNLLLKEQDLERKSEMLNEELRSLMAVEEWKKTPLQREREALLLQELVELVDKRNELVQDQDHHEKTLEDDEMVENAMKGDLSIITHNGTEKEQCTIQ